MSQAILAQALFANDAFYLAFNQGDMEAMESAWSQEQGILCLHPGWPLLTGRSAVLDSWREILSQPQTPIDLMEPTAHLAGNTVLVSCYEQLGATIMAASNLFVLENDQFRLFHHHAGPCANPPQRTRLASSPTNH